MSKLTRIGEWCKSLNGILTLSITVIGIVSYLGTAQNLYKAKVINEYINENKPITISEVDSIVTLRQNPFITVLQDIGSDINYFMLVNAGLEDWMKENAKTKSDVIKIDKVFEKADSAKKYVPIIIKEKIKKK